MAYDENGDYYFDPNSDLEDANLYHDEVKRQQVRNVVKAQQANAQEASDFNKMWVESLEGEGLDQKTYSEIYNADPAKAKSYLKEAMKHVAKGVSSGRKGKPKAENFQHGQSVQQQRRETKQSGPTTAVWKLAVIFAGNLLEQLRLRMSNLLQVMRFVMIATKK